MCAVDLWFSYPQRFDFTCFKFWRGRFTESKSWVWSCSFCFNWLKAYFDLFLAVSIRHLESHSTKKSLRGFETTASWMSAKASDRGTRNLLANPLVLCWRCQGWVFLSWLDYIWSWITLYSVNVLLSLPLSSLRGFWWNRSSYQRSFASKRFLNLKMLMFSFN